MTPELCSSQPLPRGSCKIQTTQTSAEDCPSWHHGPLPVRVLEHSLLPFPVPTGGFFASHAGHESRRQGAPSLSQSRGRGKPVGIPADQRGFGLEAALPLRGPVCSPRLGFPGLGVGPFLLGPGSGLHTRAACCHDPGRQSRLVPAAWLGQGPFPRPRRPLPPRPAPKPATAGSRHPVLPSASTGSVPGGALGCHPSSLRRCGAGGTPLGRWG